jgi:methyl-accepting chemotaxis protein
VVGVRVTEEELAELRRRASLAGVSPPRYLLEQGLTAGQVTIAERRRRLADFTRLQGQLVRATSQLAQLVDTASESGALIARADEEVAAFGQLRSDLADALDRLTDGLGGFGQ